MGIKCLYCIIEVEHVYSSDDNYRRQIRKQFLVIILTFASCLQCYLMSVCGGYKAYRVNLEKKLDYVNFTESSQIYLEDANAYRPYCV